jgi:hypothetical protein
VPAVSDPASDYVSGHPSDSLSHPFLHVQLSGKIGVSLLQKHRIPPRKLGGRERGTQTPLYCSNTTAFANVLTSPSVNHHVHVC